MDDYLRAPIKHGPFRFGRSTRVSMHITGRCRVFHRPTYTLQIPVRETDRPCWCLAQVLKRILLGDTPSIRLRPAVSNLIPGRSEGLHAIGEPAIAIRVSLGSHYAPIHIPSARVLSAFLRMPGSRHIAIDPWDDCLEVIIRCLAGLLCRGVY